MLASLARSARGGGKRQRLRRRLALCAGRDKDFRYMATSDLLAELQKESFKPDSDGERKICKCVLKLLNDQSSDVQGLAVKWCVCPHRLAQALVS